MNETPINNNAKIEFEIPQQASSVATPSKVGNPWKPSKVSTYNDLTLRPEFLGRKMRFHEGENWVRVVPAITKSKYEWMMAIHALDFPGGRFAHPKTLRPGARCAFDQAYEWSKRHSPQELYSKENKEGARLLSDPQSLCWIIAEEDGQSVVRLLVASGYDGNRGGTAGLGYRFWKAILDHNTSKSPIPDAVHPETGVKICINKLIIKGSARPVYEVRLGRDSVPIIPILDAMRLEERSCLVPLENVIRVLSHDEELECLDKAMTPETADRIRADVALANPR